MPPNGSRQRPRKAFQVNYDGLCRTFSPPSHNHRPATSSRYREKGGRGRGRRRKEQNWNGTFRFVVLFSALQKVKYKYQRLIILLIMFRSQKLKHILLFMEMLWAAQRWNGATAGEISRYYIYYVGRCPMFRRAHYTSLTLICMGMVRLARLFWMFWIIFRKHYLQLLIISCLPVVLIHSFHFEL